MKVAMIFTLFGTLVLASSCAGHKALTGSVERDGVSPETAIPVDNIKAEYEWVYAKYPESRVVRQALVSQGRRHYDLLTVAFPDGSRKEFYFDITSFFGKW